MLITSSSFANLLNGSKELNHLERWPVKTIHRLSAAARRRQPPHGFIPAADVARLITSPSPIS
jgi:hypothetical protein